MLENMPQIVEDATDPVDVMVIVSLAPGLFLVSVMPDPATNLLNRKFGVVSPLEILERYGTGTIVCALAIAPATSNPIAMCASFFILIFFG